jgi:hypothetical protein
MNMKKSELRKMSDEYRRVRKDVYQLATMPDSKSPKEHIENQRKLRKKVTEVCLEANLRLYSGSNEETALKIWHKMWPLIIYSGYKAARASDQILEMQDAFNEYRGLSDPSWDIKLRGNDLVEAGRSMRNLLELRGSFRKRKPNRHQMLLSWISSRAARATMSAQLTRIYWR